MYMYFVTPKTFLNRNRRFSSSNDVRSQAEVMAYLDKEEDVLYLYYHDLDKVYHTQIMRSDPQARVYLMNFTVIIPILQKPVFPESKELLTVETDGE